MKDIKFKTSIFLLIFGLLVTNAQKFEKDFSKEIKYSNKEVSLNANYADIVIKEWNKNKIKIDATMAVEGVSEEVAQSYFDSWKIDIENDDAVRIISKSRKRYPSFVNVQTGFDFEMPEISLESLDVLDSMNFTFPELNISEVFNDSIFNARFSKINFSKLDSLPIYSYTFSSTDNSDNLKETQAYLRDWQKNNVEYIKELALRSRELAIMHKENLKEHKKNAEKRKMLLEEMKKSIEKAKANREKSIEKRKILINKMKKERKKEREKLKASRAKIKKIISNRDKAKVRTKLIIRVPKGTDINMNINYSKISID